MVLLGRVHILETIYVGYLSFGFGAMLMTCFLFIIGVVSVLRGSSNYEARKQTEFGGWEKLTRYEHFEQVFGKHGYLHFFVPFTPIYQKDACCEPGYRRLLGPRYDCIIP